MKNGTTEYTEYTEEGGNPDSKRWVRKLDSQYVLSVHSFRVFRVFRG